MSHKARAHRVELYAIVAAGVSILFPLSLRAQTPNPELENQQRASRDARPKHRYTHSLSEQSRRESCFDVPPGELFGGIVPIGAVDEVEKESQQVLWKLALAPSALPSRDSRVEWCKTLWSAVDWQDAQARTKEPSPPRNWPDSIFARWRANGTTLIVSGMSWKEIVVVGVTVVPLEAVRLKMEYPRPSDDPRVLSDREIDKLRLLEIMSSTLQTPWAGIDQVDVRWSPSAIGAAYFSIVSSAKPENTTEPEIDDGIGLLIHGSSPQRVRFDVRIVR